jgi:hypothetical protein
MEVASREGKSRKVTRAKDVPVGDGQYSDPPAAIAVSDRGGQPELPSMSDREGKYDRFSHLAATERGREWLVPR